MADIARFCLALALLSAATLTGCASKTAPPSPTPQAPQAAAEPAAPAATGELNDDELAELLKIETAMLPIDDALFEERLLPGEEVSESPLDELAEINAEIDRERLEAERALVVESEPQFDIPMVLNDKVLFWIDYYTNRYPEKFLPGMRRSGRYIEMFREIFSEEGVPRDLVYLAQIESGFKTNAYSRAKAMGVFQFIASTGRIYDLEINYWVDERRDPEKSARASARYLKKLYGDFGDWYLALAAYNGGEGRIGRAIRRTGTKDFWAIAQTRHIRRETRNYVPAILAAIYIYKDPQKYGMDYQPDPPIRYDSIAVEGAADLQVLADCAGADFAALKLLNPMLRRDQTPPNASTDVRIPVGSGERTLLALADVPTEERVLYVRHRVRSGDTLYDLARRYDVSVAAIQQANEMGRRTMIREGKELVIPTVAAGRYANQRIAAGGGQAPTGQAMQYAVRRGDTLSQVAGRYNTTSAAIAAVSGISVSAVLHPGDRLTVVPGARSTGEARRIASAPPRTGAAEGTTHTVRRGDTLWRIAQLYQTTVAKLCSWNQISSQSTLHPGTTLTVAAH